VKTMAPETADRDVIEVRKGLPKSLQSTDRATVGTVRTPARQDRAVIKPGETSASREEVAIKATNLVKNFRDFRAVDNISFEVKKGEIFGFLGPNGAGKTTTIRMLCTLSNPTEGSATVAGFDIVKEGAKVREHIGLVSEKMIMYDRLTARENLRLFGELFSIPRDVLRGRIDELLHLVHMEEWADHQIGTFSTGMKQRINVIRALLNEPEILFLDEPTLGLDPQSTSEIREFTRQINSDRETTIILTTHAMTEADMLCDRISIIDYGKIIALDTPANLKKMIAGSHTSVVELDVPNVTPTLVSHIKSLSCAKTVTVEDGTHIKVRASGDDACGSIVDAVRSRDGKIRSVHNVQPTLEDVFLYLTGREVREQVADKVATNARSGHGPRVQNRVR
jgi:ABC-2 type transport system ATP-binding protein